jgi:hypothetical protein
VLDGSIGTQRRTSPIVDARNLRRRFLTARRAAGFDTRKAAADAFGFSLRKLDLIENGERSLLARDLDVVFDALAVPKEEHPEWRRLAEGARAKGWWDRFSEAELPPGAKRWASLEWGTRSVRGYTGTIVPGLLQTDEYTTAMVEVGVWRASPEEVRRFLSIKTHRRAVLDEPDPLDYRVIFDESVLHRDAAPGLMARQIEHILDVIDAHPNVSVQVVLFSSGLYPAGAGAFTLLDFGIDGDDGLLNIEADFSTSLFVEDFAQIATYSRLFEKTARDVAESAESTAKVLRQTLRAQRKKT